MNLLERRRGLLSGAKSKYTLLTGIHIPGGAYIDTGIFFNNDPSSAYMYGGYAGASGVFTVSDPSVTTYVYYLKNYTYETLAYWASGGVWRGTSTPAGSNDTIGYWIGKHGRQAEVNGGRFYVGNYTIYIGNNSQPFVIGHTSASNGAFDVYSCTAENKVSGIKKVFIPALNNETGMYGLIDVFNKTAPYDDAVFYGNSGAGTITAV